MPTPSAKLPCMSLVGRRVSIASTSPPAEATVSVSVLRRGLPDLRDRVLRAASSPRSGRARRPACRRRWSRPSRRTGPASRTGPARRRRRRTGRPPWRPARSGSGGSVTSTSAGATYGPLAGGRRRARRTARSCRRGSRRLVDHAERQAVVLPGEEDGAGEAHLRSAADLVGDRLQRPAAGLGEVGGLGILGGADLVLQPARHLGDGIVGAPPSPSRRRRRRSRPAASSERGGRATREQAARHSPRHCAPRGRPRTAACRPAR